MIGIFIRCSSTSGTEKISVGHGEVSETQQRLVRASEIDKEGKQEIRQPKQSRSWCRSVLLDLNCVSAIRRGSFGPNDDSFFCWPSCPTLQQHMAAAEEFIILRIELELLEAALADSTR